MEFFKCVLLGLGRAGGLKVKGCKAKLYVCVQGAVKHVFTAQQSHMLLKIFCRKPLSPSIRSLCCVKLDCSKILPCSIFLQSHCSVGAWRCSLLLVSKCHVQEGDF